MKFAKLRGRIREKFGTEVAFADAMGMDRGTISRKLRGVSPWKMPEVKKACELLDIPDSEMSDFF